MIKDVVTYTHITAGSLAVIMPILAMLFTKGSRKHVVVGNLFFVSMLMVAGSAIYLALLTNKLFLLAIGVFSLYMAVLGKYAFKSNLQWVRGVFSILFTIMVAALGLLSYISIKLVISGNMFSIVTLAFTIGIGLMLRADYRFFKTKKSYKVFHLTKMLGATIAAYTALLVVNFSNYSPILIWLGPSLIGTLLITYWIRKVTKAKPLL